MANEPSPKKLKTATIFEEFWQDKQKYMKLRKVYGALVNGYDQMNLCVLRIIESNARLSERFARATCVTSRYPDPDVHGDDKSFVAGRIFGSGIEVLRKYTNEKDPHIPKNLQLRNALAKLLHFMSQDHSALLEERNYNGKEGEWAVRIAQHLLIPLSVSDSYIIDHDLDTGMGSSCSYEMKDGLKGNAGDTSFGCSRGWHGKSDICIGGTISISLVPTDDPCGSVEDNVSDIQSISSLTEEKSPDFRQIIPQTIVFSFLQRKEKGQNSDHFLVPGIGIGRKTIIAYFYDCEEDVLLATAPLDIILDKKLNMYAVVFLWLSLNYELFCSGITNEMSRFKAEFFTRVDDFLEVYRNEVTMPCDLNNSPSFQKDESSWANCTSDQLTEFEDKLETESLISLQKMK